MFFGFASLFFFINSAAVAMAVFHDAGAEEHVDSADFGDEMEFSDSELDEQPAATGGGAAMGGPAPTAAGSTTTAPAAGGAVVARNNATFKADACAAVCCVRADGSPCRLKYTPCTSARSTS